MLESYRGALMAAMHRHLSRPARPQDRAGVLGLAKDPVLRELLASEGCALPSRPCQCKSQWACCCGCSPDLKRVSLPKHLLLEQGAAEPTSHSWRVQAGLGGLPRANVACAAAC